MDAPTTATTTTVTYTTTMNLIRPKPRRLRTVSPPTGTTEKLHSTKKRRTKKRGHSRYSPQHSSASLPIPILTSLENYYDEEEDNELPANHYDASTWTLPSHTRASTTAGRDIHGPERLLSQRHRLLWWPNSSAVDTRVVGPSRTAPGGARRRR